MKSASHSSAVNRPPRAATALRNAVCAALLALPLAGHAQAYRVRPPATRPTPLYVFPGGTLTVSATPGLVNFALVSHGTAQGSSGVTVTTTWNATGILPTLNLYAWFSDANAALTDGNTPAHTIPSAAVAGQMTTGVPTSFSPFTQSTPLGGTASGLTLINTVPGWLTGPGSRTDVLNLQIDLSSVPSLPAGTYSGVLILQATMN